MSLPKAKVELGLKVGFEGAEFKALYRVSLQKQNVSSSLLSFLSL